MAFGKFGKYYPGGAEVRPETFELIAAVREDVERVRSAEGAAHDLRFESELAQLMVRSDRLHLHYVVMNLLLNAVKYSPQGSRVELRIRRDGARIALELADQGIGVPAAELEQLFSPFYRASNVGERPGTGMGLAIVKKSAQLIKAEVKVSTAQGRGTTFTVLFHPEGGVQSGPAAAGMV